MSGSDHSSVQIQRLMLLSDSDMEEAAQQLMQLSGEDSNSSSSVNSNGNNNNKTKAKMMKSVGLFEQSQCEITSAKIEEIFGKDEISRPAKASFLEFGEEIPVPTGLSRKRNFNSPFPQTLFLPHFPTQRPIFPASPRRRTGPKKPRYRLLESIYKETKPVKVSLWE